MRLTSLTLHGFKSFGNRTTIEFSPGITAIVGPNGSGKSNVIDALKWASGGGRASEFRAGEKTELIFHGAAGKRSLGYAEVELELRGQGKRASVFRSLHRDGTGRLRLNGKNARFLDIDEELSGSGLGKSGLAIIGQGEVSGVLMADPAKLLQYVAEAAGVARLAGRREQTEERLSVAASHLERLDDLAGELERQLERLSEEAAGAARHAQLTRDSLRLRYTISRLREEGLRSELGALREDRDKLQLEVEQGRKVLSELRDGLAQRRQEQSRLERDYREALARSEARRGDVRVARARLESNQARLRDLEGQELLMAAEAESLQALEAPSRPEHDMQALQGAQADAEAAMNGARHERLAAEERVRSARLRLERLREETAAATQLSAALKSRRADLERELEEIEAQARELADQEQSRAALAEKEAHASDLEKRHSGLEEQLSESRKALQAAQSEHANALAEAQARARAAERSRLAFEARRGYAEGPRNALSSGIEGVHGSVADLLRVPEAYREALSGALGRRTEYVVVDDSATGQRVLEHVKRAGGFVTVLPLDLIAGRSAQVPERIRRLSGVIGLAGELVEVDERYRSVVDQLLGNTLVVRTMAEAVEVARSEHSRPRMVTLDGDIIESYGAMSGGRRQSQAGVLGAAAELEEAEAIASDAARRAAEAEKQLLELQAGARRLIEQERQARLDLEESRKALASEREGAAAFRELAAELERRRQRAHERLGELAEAQPAEIPEGLEAAELEVSEEEARLETLRAALESSQQQVAEYRQATAVASEKLQAFEAAMEQYRKDIARRESLGRRREQLQEEIAAARAADLELVRALAAAEDAVPDDVEEKAKAHQEAVNALAEAEAQLSQSGEALESSGEALERIRLTLARREAAWELATEELRGYPPGIPSVDGSERQLRAELSAATAELEELGAVNHRAALELEQENERLETLRAEAQQAREAMEELAATLEQLDRETTTRLEAGTAALREGFRKHVLELFGDTAEADIEVDREEGRPVGLRIRLQPPGKQTRQLNLLSVGERTMGAMAFLFSLMTGGDQQGLPIAILDEVDAPLDEANIRRYCDFLGRLARRGTQFVLITHQKATFEVADVMWGVTTEQGVSRVFSIAKSETLALG